MNAIPGYDAWCNGHSVTASLVDLQISNNVTWMDAFQFGTPDNTTWTLDGQTFELDVQRNPFDLVPLLHLDSAGGRIIIDDKAQRVIHFNVAPVDIQASLSPGVYIYDLVMIDASSPPLRVQLMYGMLKVGQGITYPAGP
jgi:hypothetical protein